MNLLACVVSLGVLTLSCLAYVIALTGYDCDRPVGIRTYSAKEVEECRNHDLAISSELKSGQVLQKLSGKDITVTRCHVTTDFTLANCGAFGHVEGIFADFPIETETITPEECRTIAHTREYNFRGNKIQVDMDAKTQKIIYLKGESNERGDSCKGGGTFSYFGFDLYDAVVPISVVITLNRWPAQVDLITGKIVINKLFTCNYTDSACTDSTYGTTVWTASAEPCTPTHFISLYEGELKWFNATLVRGVVIESKDRVAVLRPKEQVTLCGLHLTSTSLDDVYLSAVTYQLPSTKPRIDLFAYFETKLDYVYYKSRETNAANLEWIAEAICKLERQAIRLKLNVIAQATPGQVTTLGEPGIAYISNGEVIYQLMCKEIVGIKFRDTENCYQDLPIHVSGAANPNSSLIGDLFLQPLSRIIVSASPEAVCSRITPFAFAYGKQWFVAHPERAVITEPAPFPLEFAPPQPHTYVPLLPENTIYSARDVQELSRSLQLPAVREATVMSVVRRMNGMSSSESYDLTKSFTSASYDNIFTQYFNRVWGIFSSFGQAMSGVIGVWIIVKLLSSVMETLFNCSALYKTTGMSFKLLGAFFTTVTSFFLASGISQRARQEPEDKPEQRAALRMEPTLTAERNSDQTSAPTIYPSVRHDLEAAYSPVPPNTPNEQEPLTLRRYLP